MTELKSVYIDRTGDWCRSEINTGEFYLKSEADKVIAELEMKLAIAHQVLRLNKPEALYSNLETMSRLTHEKYVIERRERHHKYKRCLAMARHCETEGRLSHELASDASEYMPGLEAGFRRRAEHYEKWHKRWLKLAEKFKEAQYDTDNCKII